MKKRFILLIDLAEDSKLLVRFASNWAKKADAELLLINQVMSIAPGMGEDEIRNEIKRQERKEALAAVKEYVRGETDLLVPVKYYITTGSLESAVHKLQQSENTDIILVGIRSKNWLERFFLQSTAIRLYNEIRKIIFALPVNYQYDDFTSVHVAVKAKNPINIDALQRLLSVTMSIGKKVSFVSVIRPGESTTEVQAHLDALRDICGDDHSVKTEIVLHEDPLGGIRQYMKQHEGLLVVQKGNKSLYDFFKKDFIDELLHLSNIPIVILPDPSGE